MKNVVKVQLRFCVDGKIFFKIQMVSKEKRIGNILIDGNNFVLAVNFN